MRFARASWAAASHAGVVIALSAGCGDGSGAPPGGDAGSSGAAGSGPDENLPYAREVVTFEPGEGAGFGQASLPEVVLGPPNGHGTGAGSLDVLSLGRGGSIVLGFGERTIADGAGPDFVVFENAFYPGDDPTLVFAEPGEVSVSDDGESWSTFACDRAGDGSGRFAGCAGWSPTLEYDPDEIVPLDAGLAGGDAFDLAELGLESARFVRVVDVSATGSEPTAGFDLDAVGVVHAQ